MSYTVIAFFYSFQRGDPFPRLPHVHDFSVCPSSDAEQVSELMQLAESTVVEMLQSGAKPYISYIQDSPVGSGWSITNSVYAMPLERKISLPSSHRVIRDIQFSRFGMSELAYSHLIQGILRYEIQEVSHFWFKSDKSETIQESHLTDAGFIRAGEFVIKDDGQFGVVPFGPISRSLLNPFGHDLGFTSPLVSS